MENWMLLSDTLTWLFTIVVVFYSFKLYLLLKSSGNLWLFVACLYMLILRSVILYASIANDSSMKVCVGSLVLPFWLFLLKAVYTLYKEISKIIKR